MKTHNNIIKFKNTMRYEELKKRIRKAAKEIDECMTALETECPLDEDHEWTLSMANEPMVTLTLRGMTRI